MNTDELRTHLNRETARIGWHELQRFFATGNMIEVCATLDLVDVAVAIAVDNEEAVSNWMATEKIAPVNDSQAALWHQQQMTLWAVVVKPWILVQNKA